MQRIIKHYATVTDVHLKLIEKYFPEGFDEDDLISVTDKNGKYMRCLEVKTDEVLYLFKIDEAMVEKLEEFTDDSFEIGDMEDTFNEEEEEEY